MEQIFFQGMNIPEFKKLIGEVVESKLLQLPIAEKSIPKTLYYGRVEVAKILKISLPTLNEWSKLGILQSYRIGNRVLYKAQEIEESLEAVKNLKFKRG
ncbi:MAG: helix-turn-helix domain-containing protein [Marinilabiliales bacterium]|nr:helix-turn-helix domain-containing protein [Marinilabiliales bacterium]